MLFAAQILCWQVECSRFLARLFFMCEAGCVMLLRYLLLLSILASALSAFWRQGGVDLLHSALLTMASPKIQLPYDSPPTPEKWRPMKPEERLADVRARVLPRLREVLAERQLHLGAEVYLRGFKESAELELWMRGADAWVLFRTYPVAALSGVLGPKQREGDGQVPEGFYEVIERALNPASSYHLSFNMGYPNAHDLYLGRTGSHIMIHGDAVSIGCLAMTDPVIEEIYLLVEAALKTGQKAVPVHLFPFRMKESRLADVAETHDWWGFWRELKVAYDAFETKRLPPRVLFQEGRQIVVEEE